MVVSGTDIVRPQGQLQNDATDPVNKQWISCVVCIYGDTIKLSVCSQKKGSKHGPCRLMDFELEIGAFVGGTPNTMGEPLSMDTADDHIFGLVVMNDWSARDIQKWE